MSDRPDLEHIDVTYVADLARIALTPAETESFGRELDDILAYVEKLNELDVSDIEPTAHAAPRVNVMRDDASRPGLEAGAVLDNAPAVVAGSQIRVPAVLGGEESS